MALMLQILLSNIMPFFPKGKKSTKGKWPVSMHRRKVNFCCLCINGLRDMFNMPISACFFVVVIVRHKIIC